MLGVDTAVTILFGNEQCMQDAAHMDHELLKKAFREKVKSTHPDRAVLLGRDFAELESEFKRVQEAYEVLLAYNREEKHSHLRREYKTAAKQKEERAHPERDEKPKSHNDFMCSAPMPQRPLRFAEYLFYRRLISWKTLIKSIVWQYKMRPRLGELAITLGFLSRADIAKVMANIQFNEKFGDTAQRLSLITTHQLFILLGFQRKYDAPIGRFFREQYGLPVEKLLEENRAHNMRCHL